MRITLCLILAVLAAPLAADPKAWLNAARESKDLERWLMDPAEATDAVIDIAFSYGTGRAVTREAIDIAIAHGHAGARARAMSDLLKADLDNDLIVTREEIDHVDLKLSGYMRGLLWTRHRHADADRSGTVTFEELRAYALERADRYLSPGRADQMRALMLLDMDGDAAVTVEEAETALDQLLDRGDLEAVSLDDDA